MTIENIISRLDKVKKRGGSFTALCPSHSDRNRSLSIRETDGKILVKCFAGCDTSAIVSALGLEMKDLFIDQSNGFHSNGTAQPKRVVAVYQYTDENGELLYENVRFEPKDFRQRRFDARGKEIRSLNGIRRVPYRLPELIAAVKDAVEIWLCEGEKDADNLRSFGFTVSSFKNWKAEFNGFVKNADVVLFADHDKAGIKQANEAAKLLSGNVASLKIVDVFGNEPLPEKHGADISDFIDLCVRDEDLTVDEIAERLSIFAENAVVWQPSEESEVTQEASEIDETPIEIKPFPEPSKKCFYGLAGDFVRLIEPHTEADKMALLIQFLAYFGNIIGRSVFYKVEGNLHFTNLFCVLVGDTASGRKGTSFGRVKEVFHDLDEHHQKECLVSGLASGEGLLYHIRDACFVTKQNKDTGELEEILADAGVSDKRLLVVEGEFANVLRVQGREGNTLSAFLRNLWDSGTARSLTKNSPLKTTDAQVSIIGHITKTELLICLSEVESANGYANRFLWVCVRRSKFLPFGSEVDYKDLLCINADISRRIQFARNLKQIYLSEEAKELWVSVYEHLETSRFGFVAKVTQRASPYVLRLSCIFAVLDAQSVIGREHLEAALAVWQFCEDSAKYIFGERIGDKNADALLDALRDAENGLTRTAIYTDVFQKNLKVKEINKALKILLEMNLIESRKEQAENAKKLTEIWFAKMNAQRI